MLQFLPMILSAATSMMGQQGGQQGGEGGGGMMGNMGNIMKGGNLIPKLLTDTGKLIGGQPIAHPQQQQPSLNFAGPNTPMSHQEQNILFPRGLPGQSATAQMGLGSGTDAIGKLFSTWMQRMGQQ